MGATPLSTLMESQHAALVAKMMECGASQPGVREEDTRQFFNGFSQLMAAAAADDFGPRDEYLRAVIPPLKAAGMELSFVLHGMIRVAVGAASALPPEHAAWVAAFCADYQDRLLEVWDAS